ncbi:MAG: DMT family transporter [Clostridia bacterium]|nr:DMT family transporter [Clostridia bacterium]
MNKRLTANLMLIITALIWGFAFVAQSTASELIGSFTFNGIRFMIGAVSLIPVIYIFERRGKQKNLQKDKLTIKYGVITGVVLFIASTLQQVGVMYMEIDSKAGFITGMYTVIVPIFGLFMKKKTSLNTWFGAMCAVLGLYFVSVAGVEKIELGDVICFIGAFFWALHIIVIDEYVDKVNPIMYSAVQFFTCSVINIVLMFVFEMGSFSLTNVYLATVPILYAGVMSSGIAYTLQVLGQKNSKPTEAAIIFSMESVFAALGCWMILGHSMSIISLVGCALILAGVILSQLNFKKGQ